LPHEGIPSLRRLKVFCAARSWPPERHGIHVVAGCLHHTPSAAAVTSHTAGWQHHFIKGWLYDCVGLCNAYHH